MAKKQYFMYNRHGFLSTLGSVRTPGDRMSVNRNLLFILQYYIKLGFVQVFQRDFSESVIDFCIIIALKFNYLQKLISL